MSGVSIIIPTLNEAECLGRTLRQLSLLEPPAAEVWVVDGGSVDETLAIAKAGGVNLLTCSPPGRSVQMNQGAAAATGDVLCFLHADTGVPDDLVTLVEQTLLDPRIVGGGFISLMA
ncbi:MAG TPA: glycosyltransferase, partial [Candidatus Caenarcaniphilales bacterium]